MAEIDPRRKVISDPFGVSYDPTANKWRKTRTFNTFGALRPLRSIKQYTAGHSSYSHGMQTETPARRVAVRKLTRARPELLPALETAMENFHDSSRFAEQPGHLMNELLAIGYINEAADANDLKEKRGRKQHTILAMLARSSTDTIFIIALNKSVSYFDEFPGINLKTSEPNGDLRTTWSIEGASIKQITFTPLNNRNASVLAVRTGTSIHILRLVISESKIHVFQLLDIPLHRYLDSECVYISFNQHDRKVLAGITSGGEIVLWSLQNWGTGQLKYLLRHKAYSSANNYDHSKEDGGVKQDEWRKISWGPGPPKGTLLLCDRVHVECWDAQDLEFLTAYYLPWATKSPLVDLLVCKSQYSEILLLTTSEVRMLRLHVEAGDTTFETLLSWQHGRDHGDLLLQMWELNNGLDKHLFLYSHSNNLVTIWSLNGSTVETIYCREQARMPWQHTGVLGIVHHLLHHHSSSVLKENPIWEVFFLARDLSLHGCICFAPPQPAPMKDKINFGAPSHIFGTNPLELESHNNDDDEEGYESGIDGPDLSGTVLLRDTAKSYSYSVPRQRILNAMTSSWKEDMKLDKDTIDGLCTKILGYSLNKVKTLVALATYATVLMNTEEDKFTSPLADEVKRRLGERGFDEAGKWLVTPFAAPDLLGLAKIGVTKSDLDIDEIYKQLLTVYNRPLNSTIKGQQRLLKEAIARRVAGILCSAAIGVRFSPVSEDDQEAGASPLMIQSSQRTTQGTQKNSSQAMPSSMGVEMASSAGDILAERTDPVAHSLAGLGKLAIINPSSADSTSMLQGSAKGLAEVLAHWDVNVDPSEYSYEATNAMLVGETFIQGSAMSIADREKAARREMRARQRQVERQARSEATASKNEKLDPTALSSSIPIGKAIHGEPIHEETQPSRSQMQSVMKSSIAGESLESPSTNEAGGSSRLTTAAADESLNSSRKGSQQGSTNPSQSLMPRTRLPDRGRKLPKKRGF